MPNFARKYSLRLRPVQGDILSHDDVTNVRFPPQTVSEPVEVITFGISGFKLNAATTEYSATTL
ncbi:hypothetical protein CKAH01_01265 [Colletotrichum kahawae]|uniref:Uncharacterized protein n=1 Tax=Colletotrichum kahawae TaxID=34407 RepID=A0AAD9YCN5_COLKA|nr:hypothetical protein CKAH01_01265 [Colletotrichum kahawae]